MTKIIPPAGFDALNATFIVSSTPLNRFIQCIWAAEYRGIDVPFASEKLYPNAGASIRFEIHDDDVSVKLALNQNVRISHWLPGANYLGVQFRPGGVTELFGADMLNALFDEVDLLHATFRHKERLKRLTERLLSASSTQSRLNLIHRWLVCQTNYATYPRLAWSALASAMYTRALSVEQLTPQCGYSRRTLERNFRRYVGFSPNQIHRFGQLHKARLLLLSSQKTLIDIALECGFFDQAHFTHSFRNRTKETPLQYRQRKMSQIYNK